MNDSPPASSGIRIFPPGIYAAGLLVGFLLQWLWPLRIASVELRGSGRLLGIVLLGAWLFLGFWAVLTFRRAGTTPNPTLPASALALGGPYRFTRNPMYLSFILMQLGVSFLFNALWPLLTLPAVVLVVRRFVIDREEQYLIATFGEQYVAYKARVRRWL